MASSTRPTSLVLAKTSTTSSTAPVFKHQLSEPAVDNRRKLSESRGVHLPNIKIVDDSTCTSPTAPQTALSPIGTVVRRHNATATPMRAGSVLTVDVKVYLPSLQFVKLNMELTPGGVPIPSTAILKQTASVLDLPLGTAVEAFALWMTSPLMQVQLKPDHCAWEVRRAWRQLVGKYVVPSVEQSKHADALDVDRPLLALQRNYILSKTRERQLRADALVLELLFAGARQRHMEGTWPCTTGEAVSLAAVDLVLSHGKYDQDLHTCEWLRDVLVDVVPVAHLARVRCKRLFGYALHACGSHVQINNEQQILAEYRKRSGEDFDALRRQYLDECMQRPCYGSAQFRCHVERSSRASHGLVAKLSGRSPSTTIAVRVCISREFVTLYEWREGASTDTLLLVRPLLDCQWRPASAIARDDAHKLKEPLNARDLQYMPSVLLHYADDTAPHANETSAEMHASKAEGGSCLVQLFTRQSAMIIALLDACVTSTQVELAQRMSEERLNNDDDEEMPIDDVIERCVDDRLPIASPLHGRGHDERMARARLDASGKCMHVTPNAHIARLIKTTTTTTVDGVDKADTVVVFREH